MYLHLFSISENVYLDLFIFDHGLFFKFDCLATLALIFLKNVTVYEQKDFIWMTVPLAMSHRVDSGNTK